MVFRTQRGTIHGSASIWRETCHWREGFSLHRRRFLVFSLTEAALIWCLFVGPTSDMGVEDALVRDGWVWNFYEGRFSWGEGGEGGWVVVFRVYEVVRWGSDWCKMYYRTYHLSWLPWYLFYLVDKQKISTFVVARRCWVALLSVILEWVVNDFSVQFN